jgi:hypothetical protein
MSDHKKLQTFIFSDNFGWAFIEVQREAFNAALRRSEMMGWSEISIKPVSTVPLLEGNVRNYQFEIWGIGESVADDSKDSLKTNDHETGIRQVAREADI